MEELLFICYSGTHLVNNLDDDKRDLYNDVFNKYFVPIGYKTIQLSSLSDKHGKKTNNANSIFEDFNIAEGLISGRIDELSPSDKSDIHSDFGAFCYVGLRHSLAHGWASGPTSWLTQYVLGVNVSDGGNTVTIKPHLGNLEFVKGTFPTKFGVLKISHKKNAKGKVISTIDAPDGLKVKQ